MIDCYHCTLVVKRLVIFEPVGCLSRDGDNLALIGLSASLIIFLLGWKSKSTHTQFALIHERPHLPH